MNTKYACISIVLSGYTADDGDCWPLEDDQLSIINKNSRKLTELLESDGDLIGHMMATDCFSQGHLKELQEEHNRSERNKKLLDMLKRRSKDQFKQLVACLEKTQRHLVPFLTGDTGKMLYGDVYVYVYGVFSVESVTSDLQYTARISL
jgi:hypothetical protein